MRFSRMKIRQMMIVVAVIAVLLGCHRALQNQPLMGASKPAMTLGGFSSTIQL